MKPVINPIWFYFASTLEGLKDFFFIIGVLTAIIGIIATFFSIFGEPSNDFEERICHITCPKYVKCLWVGIFMLLLGTLTPDQSTCYKIMAANLVTPNNLEIIGETTTDVIDYIVDSVDKILEENKE